MRNIPEYLIIHHTGAPKSNLLLDTSTHTFEIIDAYHRSLGWESCGYHYVIEKDGKVAKNPYRDDDYHGAHCSQEKMNTRSLGICLTGNFDATMPTKAQIRSLKELIREKRRQYNIPLTNIVPHRVFATYKSCFGTKLSAEWLRNISRHDFFTRIVNFIKHIFK
ncbi:hypothetical protein COB64_02140 [Candidatus Wolfebacteria bacterium]|nr:MAG: hypothetical protein COB64_02140 [Candidatus Wolfebacteria bacterium]